MQLVADGGKVTEPDALTKTGFTFMGWYSDSSLEESCEWDFSNAVSEPTTLYAKWLSSNAGVTAVSVDGKAGEIKGTDISVELPHNTTPPTEGSKITIQTAGGASVSALTTNDNGETWTFTVTAEDGNTKETYTIHVSGSKTHTFGDWQPGADNHYKECVCGERMEEAHNAPDDGDCLTAVKCTVCNYETKAAEASHSFTSYTSDGNATCTADGTETAKCNHSGCNQADTRTETGSKLEHSYRSVVTPPTCTEKGYTTHTCTRCGYSYQDSHTDVDGHTFGGWTQISSPICTDNGAKKRTCQKCGYTETEDITSNGHQWEDYFTIDKAATCTSDGSRSIHCKNCDVVKDSEVISKTEHSYGNLIAEKPATHTATGMKAHYICSQCGGYFDENKKTCQC